nr:MAG TPA: hypothetical protein [Caudoviricetes sp.]
MSRRIYKNTPSFIADQATTSRGDIMASWSASLQFA